MTDVTRPAELRTELERFRRRLLLVAFVRACPVAALIALGVTLPIGRVAHLQFAGTLATAALCGLAAVFAAAWIAHRRTGSLDRVAATLDRRFGFANRLATALQFESDPDGIARLISADAFAVLRRRRPRDVEFEMPRHLAWIAAGSAAVALAFAVTTTWSSETDASVASQGVLGGPAATPPSSGRRAIASTTAPSSPAGAATRLQETDATGGRDRRPSARSNNAETVDTGASQQTTPRPSTEQTAASGGELRRQFAIQAPQSSTGQNGGSSGQPADQLRSANPNGGPGNSSRTARGDFGGGAGATLSRSTTTRAGGVRGSNPDAARGSDREQVGASNRASPTPSAAWDRAESAIEREHLSVHLRTYVRDYLAAIRSGGLP